MKLLACNGTRSLTYKIEEWLGCQAVKAEIGRFSDGEVFVEIEENVRGEDVFVIQTTSSHDNIIELLIAIDALKRSSAKRIIAVIPYFGYARQDRKVAPRTPISAKLIANLLTTAGVHRILTVDLHSDQIQGFFDIPLDHLTAIPLFELDIRSKFTADVVIVASDIGGVKRARNLANRLDIGLAIVDKRREKPGISEVMHIMGEVENKHCVVIDDIIDSGGSICNAAHALIEKNVKSVHVYGTHAVFSRHAPTNLVQAPIQTIVISDSIPKPSNTRVALSSKLNVISIAPLLSEAIKRISSNDSVSDLFSSESLKKALQANLHLI